MWPSRTPARFAIRSSGVRPRPSGVTVPVSEMPPSASSASSYGNFATDSAEVT